MKTISILFLILLSVFNSKAQLLYKIESPNMKKSSYLYGTIHIMPKNDFIISDTIKKALLSCQTLAMEIDMNMDLKTKVEIVESSMLPGGKSIADITSKENAEKIRNFCTDSLGWKETKYNKMSRFRPFFLSSVITQELIGKSKSYETEFNEIARKNNLSMTGLETIQFQMKLMNEISDEEHINMLLSSLTTDNSEFEKLLSAYLKKDLELLDTLLNNAELSPEFYSNFIVKRNQKWIPIISDLILKNSTFIAVGAAHLPGEEGVLNLLRKAGYTITPVD